METKLTTKVFLLEYLGHLGFPKHLMERFAKPFFILLSR